MSIVREKVTVGRGLIWLKEKLSVAKVELRYGDGVTEQCPSDKQRFDQLA